MTKVRRGVDELRAKQEALVVQDPETFEPSFTTSRVGWLQIRLGTVDRDELVELAEDVAVQPWS